MSAELAFKVCLFGLIATAIHVVANGDPPSVDIQYQIGELNKKLDELQKLVDLFQLYNETNMQPIVMRPTTTCTDTVSRGSSNHVPSSCEESFQSHNESGIYQIYVPESGVVPLYCLADPNHGKPWTVLQRRVDASTDFYRDWAAYKRGFGNLNKNFILGMDLWNMLTTQGEPQELWVHLKNKTHTLNAYYKRFAIGDESQRYVLKELGAYSGNAGDAMRYHLNEKFYTRGVSGNGCAAGYHGAWWYKNCHSSHLNGVYGSTKPGEGLHWAPNRLDREFERTMTYAHMAIRTAT